MAQAYGASISLVHDTLLDLANKDQQGFVSNDEFNGFAQIAQLNIYNGLFDELKDAKRLSRAGFNPMRDKSRIKRIEEDLSYFSKKSTIHSLRNLLYYTSGYCILITVLFESTGSSVEIECVRSRSTGFDSWIECKSSCGIWHYRELYKKMFHC